MLITGMGGELGTRVAQLVEQRPWAGEIVGVDFVPPRRRLRRAEFHRIDPRDRDRLAEFVEDFAPTVVAHFGVYEPASRMSPASAIERTELCTIATMSAAGTRRQARIRRGAQRARGLRAADAAAVGARRRRDARAAHAVRPVAARGRGGGRRVSRLRHGVSVCALRYAPVVGPHVPSPLGRLLRLPVVPVPAFADPPFSLLHPDDAAEAMVAAIDRRYDGALNIVGPGAATPWQAVRLGGRIPLPVVGPMWEGAARDRRVGRRRGRAARDRVAAPRSHRRRRPRGGSARACDRSAPDANGAARAVRVGRRDPDPDEPRGSRVTRTTSSPHVRDDQLGGRPDRRRGRADRRRRCAAGSTVATRSIRSATTRSSSISSRPCSRAALRVEVDRRREPSARPGRRCSIANRGFGVVEPAVLGISVRRVGATPAADRRRARAPARRRRRSAARCDQRERARPARVPERRSSRRGPARTHVVAIGRGHPAAVVDAGDDARADRPGRGHARRPVRHWRSRPWRVQLRFAGDASPIRTTPTIRSPRPGSPKRCATRSSELLDRSPVRRCSTVR